jgi:hypothetical protein
VTRDTEYLGLESQFNKVVGDAEEIRIETMVYRDSVSSKVSKKIKKAYHPSHS